MGLAARSLLASLAFTLFPAESMAKPPAAPPPPAAAKKQPKPPKNPKKPTPAPAPVPEPTPAAPPPAEVQNREDPNAKSPEELAKEKESAKKDGDAKNTALGALLGVTFPVGPYAGVTGVGVGASIDFQHHLVPAVAIGGRVGFQYHLDANSTRVRNGVTYDIVGRAHVVPITISLRVYPIPEGSSGAPYFLLEPGVFLRFASQTETNPTTQVSKDDALTKANFGVGIGAGYTIKGFDIRAMFHTFDLTLADVRLALGIHVGYRFLQF